MPISFNNNVFPRAACLCAILLFIMMGCGQIQGREEFTKAVMNKSEQEVTDAVGKPAAVDASNPARVRWTYNAVTYDIDKQNKRDDKSVVIFAPSAEKGQLKVVGVEFS